MKRNRTTDVPEEKERRAERNRTRHYAFRAALLLAYSWYIHGLVFNGSLFHYVAPRMEVAVKLASIGLILLAGAQIWMALGGNRGRRLSCDCCGPAASPNGFRSSKLLYTLFLLPVAYAVLLPTGVSGSELAGVKGMTLSGPDGPQASVSTLLPSPGDAAGRGAADDDYNSDFAALAKRLYAKSEIVVPETGYLEVLRSVDLYLDRFAGKRMTVSGFVFREKEMQPNEFAVARLVMSCCAADASSYGVLVRVSGETDLLQDTWVKVSGTVVKGSYGGEPVLALRADRLTKIQPPSNPYVYLYDGSYDDLAN